MSYLFFALPEISFDTELEILTNLDNLRAEIWNNAKDRVIYCAITQPRVNFLV